MFFSSKQSKTIFSYSVLLAYCAMIFFFSNQSFDPQKIYFRFNDKVAHFLEYAVLGILAFQALRQWGAGGHIVRAMQYAWIFACLYGLSDELHQAFVPGRNSSVADWAFDAMGSLAGILLFRIFFWPVRLQYGEN